MILAADFRTDVPRARRARELTLDAAAGSRLALAKGMLKLLGAYALAKLLGFGLLTAIVIYMLIR